VTFSFWSLDFIYYPVSGIMWVWHKVFGFLFEVLGAENPYANPWAWVLSVMFLVFTLRMIMFKPFMKQMDASLKMQKIQPEMKRIREKYKDDRQKLTEEMMKLNKEAGVNPLASCLPALLQAPAFIGLFHVLRNFILSYSGGPPAIKVSDAPINNYFFPVSDVQSFHDALLFGGASLSAHLTMTDAELSELGSNRETMLWVGIPLMILAAFATHLSSRKSIARQTTLGTAQTGGQMAIMQKLMLWVFPLGVLFIGAFYPLALLFYWLANNFWTFGQLALAHRLQDKKLAAEATVVEAAKEQTSFSKPKPGAKPVRDVPGRITPTETPSRDGSSGGAPQRDTKGRTGSAGTSGSANGSPKRAGGVGPSGGISLNGDFLPPPGAAPRPGAKPKKKKR
jgi:YidC/Oxa1 family membrane protein insertase